jgi:hypothetical protein
MYPLILAAHSIVRWLVLLSALWALYRAYTGWLGGKAWTPGDKQAGFLFTTAFDLQLLLGIFLAAISPLTQAALAAPGGIMSSDVLRFFIAEHIPVMLVAWIVVHATTVIARRVGDDGGKLRRSALGYSLALLMVAVAVPWWRPLFPGL